MQIIITFSPQLKESAKLALTILEEKCQNIIDEVIEEMWKRECQTIDQSNKTLFSKIFPSITKPTLDEYKQSEAGQELIVHFHDILDFDELEWKENLEFLMSFDEYGTQILMDTIFYNFLKTRTWSRTRDLAIKFLLVDA